MAQQINLLTPILLAPRRYLSALTLVQATGLMALACVAASLWLQHRDRQAEAAHQETLQRLAAERQALLVARAGLPAPQDALALQQQLQPLQAGNAERRALLQSLDSGQALEGRRHSDLLAWVAQSLPESAWLSELRYAPGRLEIVGGTLDTSQLRPWLSRLSAQPLLAGQQLSALRVEKLGAQDSDGPSLLERSSAIGQTRLPVWAFRVVSAPASASAPASGAER